MTTYYMTKNVEVPIDLEDLVDDCDFEAVIAAYKKRMKPQDFYTAIEEVICEDTEWVKWLYERNRKFEVQGMNEGFYPPKTCDYCIHTDDCDHTNLNTCPKWKNGVEMTDCVELISMKANGDIYVKGELITNNSQLVEAFNEWRVALEGDTTRIHSVIKERDALTKERDVWKAFAEQMKALFTFEAIFREVYSAEEVEHIINEAAKTCGIKD